MGLVHNRGRGGLFNRGTNKTVISNWTPQKLGTKLLFWGKVSEISGGQMPNKVTGATDFLTVAGSPYTFKCPDTSAYIIADTDYIWFKTNTAPRIITTTELIGYDFARTIVKYDNTSPYAIREIIILKAGIVLNISEINSIHTYMQLPIYWGGVWNDYGYPKQNRGSAANSWTAEVVPDALALIPTGVRINWVDRTGGTAQTEIWGRNNSDAYALLYTEDAGVTTKDDTGLTAVDLRCYKTRTLLDGVYSNFSSEISIALMSANLAINMGGVGTTDFVDSNTDGLADGLDLTEAGGTLSIVTGNGFTGNAQRLQVSAVSGVALRTVIALLAGDKVRISFKYRSNSEYFHVQDDPYVDLLISTITKNTGNAILKTVDKTIVNTLGHLRFFCYNDPTTAYIEVGEVNIRKILI